MFDMSQVSYISSAGVGVFLKAENIMKQRGGILAMSNLQPQVKKVFDVLKVIPHEQMFKSIRELDNYLDAIQRKEKQKRQSPWNGFYLTPILLAVSSYPVKSILAGSAHLIDDEAAYQTTPPR